ncbi:MAG: hypothetical protein U9R23_03075 [Candidatus Cloacimonadota bacterium]|nr:hypothetical protein [Candidatus Cloacimonadota bacterium]
MTQHKDIQDPKNYSEMHYKYFEAKLFSKKTNKEELEDICMTLAHLPTKEAQDLLDKFKKSERANEVEWLECAIDEGKHWYLSPTNEKEERDFLALKMLQMKDDEIVELMGKRDEHDFQIRTMSIELKAFEKLAKEKGNQNEDDELKYRIIALQDLIKMEIASLEEVDKEIELQEKIQEKIKQSITTERYKDVDPMYMNEVHFDGEVW